MTFAGMPPLTANDSARSFVPAAIPCRTGREPDDAADVAGASRLLDTERIYEQGTMIRKPDANRAWHHGLQIEEPLIPSQPRLPSGHVVASAFQSSSQRSHQTVYPHTSQ